MTRRQGTRLLRYRGANFEEEHAWIARLVNGVLGGLAAWIILEIAYAMTSDTRHNWRFWPEIVLYALVAAWAVRHAILSGRKLSAIRRARYGPN